VLSVLALSSRDSAAAVVAGIEGGSVVGGTNTGDAPGNGIVTNPGTVTREMAELTDRSAMVSGEIGVGASTDLCPLPPLLPEPLEPDDTAVTLKLDVDPESLIADVVALSAPVLVTISI
jgi:hypothetical protein